MEAKQQHATQVVLERFDALVPHSQWLALQVLEKLVEELQKAEEGQPADILRQRIEVPS